MDVKKRKDVSLYKDNRAEIKLFRSYPFILAENNKNHSYGRWKLMMDLKHIYN